MSLIESLAATFQVTDFDVIFFGCIGILSIIFYYFLSLHQVFEAAFGAMVGLGIYILLSVILIGNAPIGSNGGLFPFGFSVFIVSIAIYLVFILAVLFPLHGGLIIAEPTHPTLYTVLYFFTSGFFLFSIGAIMIYMIEQTYIFHPGTIFTYLKDVSYYADVVKKSNIYGFIIDNRDIIIPLGILLMLYKILLSNLVNAALLSIWYNLSHVGFYRRTADDAHYRVEFHEVGGGHGGGHDDHGGGHGDTHTPHADDHGGGHDAHGHH